DGTAVAQRIDLTVEVDEEQVHPLEIRGEHLARIELSRRRSVHEHRSAEVLDLREDVRIVVRRPNLVHVEDRLGDPIIQVAGGDRLQRRAVDRVDQLEEQERPLVSLALERLDQSLELGYGLVELHTVSTISGSLSSITGLSSSPQSSLAGSTSTTRTSPGSPPSAPQTTSVLSSEITPVTASETRAWISRSSGRTPSQR